MFIHVSCSKKKETDKDGIPNSKVSTIYTQKTMKSIDSFIEQKMDKSGIAGLGAAIILNNEVVWIKGFGYADKENKIPFTKNTVMCIGSISKTFTGALLMRAVEDELLSLDEDINTYLPFELVNPFFPNEKITLRHLATHTSGLADDYDVYDKTYYFGKDSPESLGDFLKNYFAVGGKHYSEKNFLNNKPGTYRDYSNIAAGLAGYIIELKAGKKLNKYGKERIFEPLKMDNTGWLLSEINLENHSKQYEKVGDSLRTIPLYGITTYPDGGVRSSVSDLSRFFIALLNEGEYQDTRILKNETVSEMLRFQFTSSNKPENINLEKPNKNSGIFWSTKFDVTYMGHGGSDWGVLTSMLSDLKKEVAIILFVNTSFVDERDGYAYSDIYRELFKYGMRLKPVPNNVDN